MTFPDLRPSPPSTQGDTHPRGVAMTLSLSDDEVAALQAQAEAERRSAEDVAADGVREYVSRHAHRAQVHAATERVVARYAEALRELENR